MKLSSIVLAVASLAACATTSPQQAFGTACANYNAALVSASKLDNAGQLSKAEVQAVSELDNLANPICNGPIPTDTATLNADATKVATAATSDAIQAIVARAVSQSISTGVKK